jgi:hypothetical protein
MDDVAVPIGSVVSKMTLNIRITGVRRYVFRVWLAARLMGLAARIAGTQIEMWIGDEPGSTAA